MYCANNSKRILYHTVSHPDIGMWLHSWEKERGCGYNIMILYCSGSSSCQDIVSFH
jgi:hypothetical protein